MADIRNNDAPAAALAAPPPPAQPAAVHADLAAATAQHDRLAERLDGQPAPPPAGPPPLAAAPASTTSQPPPSTASDAARAVRFRPSATNEWDRMPAEIQNKILAHAGVLTLWVNGRIDDAKLDIDQFKALLSDVFETNWQGDLTTLPFDKFNHSYLDDPFWQLRSRSMHTRVKALGFDNLKSGLEQAAMLNGWTDLLDFEQPRGIARNAARCGSITMLEHLVDERKVVTLDEAVARQAAEFGHLDLLKWLHDRMPDGSWSAEVMNCAAEHGHLSVVKWLHMNRTEGCTTDAMDKAAFNGFLNVIKWLHANRTEGCTEKALNYACWVGKFNIVIWLHMNRTEGCTTSAMDGAASEGYLTIIKWLQENRTEGCTTDAIDFASMYGFVDCVKWLHANRNEGCTSSAIEYAAQHGHADIVEFLHKNRTEGSIREAAKTAAQYNQCLVLQRIDTLAPDAITGTLVDEAASYGCLSALEWLIDKTGVTPRADAITLAVRNGNVRILPWFRKHMPDMFRAHAASKFGNESADAVIDWFDREDLPSYYADVISLAIKEQQILVVKWFLEHLGEKWFDGRNRKLARELVGTA